MATIRERSRTNLKPFHPLVWSISRPNFFMHLPTPLRAMLLTGLAPRYVCEMLECYIPARKLRSPDNYFAKVPSYNLESCGGRAFSVVVVKL